MEGDESVVAAVCRNNPGTWWRPHSGRGAWHRRSKISGQSQGLLAAGKEGDQTVVAAV